MNKSKKIVVVLCLSILLIIYLFMVKADSGKTKKYDYSIYQEESKIRNSELTSQSTKELALLCKVWGFLKYHHPNIAKEELNWDYELFRILPEFCKAKSITERNNLIYDWITELGDFEKEETELSKNVKIYPDTSWFYSSGLDNKLIRNFENIRKAKKRSLYLRLQKGVGNPVFENEAPYHEFEYPDVGYRLLALFRYWNIIQYYFPYKYLIGEDWENTLEEFIPKFIKCPNSIEYRLVVLELITRINDTHAKIYRDSSLEKYTGYNFAPFEIKFINDSAIVTNYFDEKLGKETGVKIGDVILEVDNQLVEEIVERKLKYTPASNYSTKLRNIAFDFLRTNDSILDIVYKHNKKSFKTKIRTYQKKELNISAVYQKKDTCFKFIQPDIAYIYLGNFKREYVYSIINDIKSTKGLIIDLRCYPSDFVVFDLGKYFISENTDFVKFTCVSLKQPGLFTFTKPLGINKEDDFFYGATIVILVNEMTQSRAEYTAMAFRAAPNAIVIGRTTAGADGNVSEFFLPGGIRTMISGIGVYYPDGQETQRVGIIPDIEVKPTVEGIRKGRDEVLEKAIEILNKK
jgi:C-terminal processing protease CtpA/Prc